MLARAVATIGSLTFVSRILGFVRDILIAKTLGAGLAADAFFLAFRLPNLFRKLLGEGAFNSAFVPLFSGLLQKDGKDKAVQFAAQAFSLLLVANLVLLAVFLVFMPLLLRVLAPGFEVGGPRYELAVELARIMFPYLMLITLASQCGAMLNSVHHFGHAAAMPILLNLIMSGTMLVATGSQAQVATQLAWSVTAAGVAQLLYIWVTLRTADLRLYPARPRQSPEVRRFFILFGPGVVGAGVYQLNVTVDMMFASVLGEGAISWLSYADRLNQLPLGVIGTAMGTALIPLLSRQIKAGDWGHALRTQAEAIRMGVFIAFPAMTAFLLMAVPMVRILFERGAFSPADSLSTAHALQAFAVGLPAYILIKIFSSSFFAQQDTKTPVKIAMLGLVMNVILNFAFMKPLGFVGVALSTSLSAWVNVFMFAYLLQKTPIAPHWGDVGGYILRVTAACLGMAGVVWGALHGLEPFLSHESSSMKAAALSGVIAAGGITYFALAMVMKIGDVRTLKQKLKKPAVT